jgi:endonuclease III
MTKKERFLRVAAALEQLYPDARCSLFSGNAFELLVAVRLSAQCTDARVNQVTPALFAKYPTLEDYCNADVADIATDLLLRVLQDQGGEYYRNGTQSTRRLRWSGAGHH